MTASDMLRGLIYSGKDFNHMAPAARCPFYPEKPGCDQGVCPVPPPCEPHAAEPPPFACTVCVDTGIEWDDEDGPQPCTNRIHEEVKDG